MKINKIYISAFGGLKDCTINLNDGLNVIFGENENGKSTVMAFIKMMFYGSGKKAPRSMGIRQKYTPWSGDIMGGRIYFEHDSKRYCLEREFKKSDAYDRISLTDTDLNTSLPVSGDIGTKFFGLTAAAFERSLFIGAFCAVSGDDEAAGELNSKLSNLALTADEDVSFKAVYSRIEAASHSIISKGKKKGKFNEDSKRLEELTAELEESSRSLARKSELEKRLNELKGEYEATKKLYDETKRILERENDVKNLAKLKEYTDIKQQLDSLNEGLKLSDGKLCDEMFVKKVDFCLNRLDSLKERMAELKAQIEKIKATVELSNEKNAEESRNRLSQAKEKLKQLEDMDKSTEAELDTALQKQRDAEEGLLKAQSSKKLFNPLFLILGLITSLIGGLLLFLSPRFLTIALSPITYLFAAVFAVGIVMIILSFIIRPLNRSLIIKSEAALTDTKNKAEVLNAKLTSLKEQQNTLLSQINLLSEALNADAAMRARQQSELSERQSALALEKEKENAVSSDLLSVFSRYSEETSPHKIREILKTLNEKAEQQKQLKLRLKYLSSDLGNISYEQAQEKLSASKDISGADQNEDFEEVKAREKQLNQKISELISEVASITTELKTSFKQISDPALIQKEIDTLKESLSKQKQFLDATEVALEVLKESFAEVRRGYGSVLEKKTLDIFSRLTAGRYSSINISDTLDMTVEPSQSFGTRELEFLSSGTMDQAYLSLRLAASELISEEEQLPIIMDDSLSQYDDIRTAEAIAFLKEYSLKTQVLLFTCHNAVCSTAKEIGIEITEL